MKTKHLMYNELFGDGLYNKLEPKTYGTSLVKQELILVDLITQCS